MKHLLVRDLLAQLNTVSQDKAQRSPEYLEWINSDLVGIVEEFTQKNNLMESHFIKSMNKIFKTNRFEFLLKRWLVEYFLKLFKILSCSKELILDDTPLNRFGLERYFLRFKILPKVKWKKQTNLLQKIVSIFLRGGFIIYLSLNSGLKISGKRKKYKVMREALWGLRDIGGYYFHDDFFVDGIKIKKEDLLLFSRGIPTETGRLKGYNDAKKSPYAYFNLNSLPISVKSLFLRVVPKYIILATNTLFREIYSTHFSLYWSVYLYFIYNALPYEKVFSHFEVTSELAHNCFAAGHIPEVIVCQNYGTKYYFMNWSDLSVDIDSYIVSFLGCDGYLLWGKAHFSGKEGGAHILMPTGYVFKRFIKEAAAIRGKILSEMNIEAKGKIITFFDESFGGVCKMTEENFVTFWETALKLAQKEPGNTILIKPKGLVRYNNLSYALKERFSYIKSKMEKMPNVYIVDKNKWSFIECIGISDIVITQGMTSSATIAIICGIAGLYLDQAHYNHPFSMRFKDRIVFDDSDKLIFMIQRILKGIDNPLKDIPEQLLRAYDAYSDDRGIDLFRDILSGQVKKKVGIIVQARMNSTRLPGKIMKPILGRSMLEVLIENLKKVKNQDMLIIATTRNKTDDIVEELANRLGVVCFRGDENDVLDRYYKAGKIHNLDVIVRVTSDCPLMDPLLVDSLIKYYFDNQPVDYVSNIIKRTYPRGFDIEVFSFGALKLSAKNAKQKYQREHVTPYILEFMKTKNYDNVEDMSFYRLTVDTQEDFVLISEIFEELRGKPLFDYGAVMQVLKRRPELLDINRHILQKTV